MNRRVFGAGVLALGAVSVMKTARAAAPGGGAIDEAAIDEGAIDEGAWVPINGTDQWLAIRGRDVRNPVLLVLHGGPGIGIASMMPLFDAWTRDFTVALWDQPASGATGMRHFGGQGELTVERYVRDGIAVAQHLSAKFGGLRLALLGMSWGTRLGLHLVRQRPELFSAYAGTAQPVGRRGDVLGYELALRGLRERGNAAGIAALERIGPPPYERFEDFLVRQQFTNPPALPMSDAEAARTEAMSRLLNTPDPGAPYLAATTPPPGFDGMALFFDTLRATWPQWDWEIRDFGRSWQLPMFVFQGTDDLNAPAPLAREWLAGIAAPAKAYEAIPGAGHNTLAFHDELGSLLKRHVLEQARRAG